MIGSVIALTEIEERLMRWIAHERFKSNRAAGVPNAKVGKQSNELTDLEGVCGEIAFCRLFNLYPGQTLDISPRSSRKGQDGGGDAVMEGVTIDVKTTCYENGKLLATPWKDGGVECYALMTGTCPNYTFRGFMRSCVLSVPGRLGDLGHGATHIAHQWELLEWGAILQSIRKAA